MVSEPLGTLLGPPLSALLVPAVCFLSISTPHVDIHLLWCLIPHAHNIHIHVQKQDLVAAIYLQHSDWKVCNISTSTQTGRMCS